jgi:hypothetical protein
MMSMTLSIRNNVWALLCLALIAHPSQVLARDSEPPRLDSTASAAVGAGFELSHGDYGVNADATIVTLPVSVFLYPVDRMDITLEVPLVYLSSRSDSGVVVTGSGGVGRGRGANKPSTATGATTVHHSGVGDVNMTAGWTLLQDGEGALKVRPTFYLKIPTGDLDRGLGTGTVEAGPGFSVSKWLGNVQLFGEGAYIFQNSKLDYPGRNYVSYLGGAGIQATDRLFVSLRAEGSSARSDGAEDQAEGRLTLNFMHSRRISWEIYGSAGFTDASPDFGGGVMMIYQF